MIYIVDTGQKTINFKAPAPFKSVVETIESVFGSDNAVRVFMYGSEYSLSDCRRMAGTISVKIPNEK